MVGWYRWTIHIESTVFQSCIELLCQEICYQLHRGLNWIFLPLVTPARSLLPGVMVSFANSFSSGLKQNLGSVFRKFWALSHTLLICHAASCSWPFFTKGWISPAGDVNNLPVFGNSIGLSTNLASIWGYHSWVFQVGVTRIISPPSLDNLARHLVMRQNGGKVYIILPFHLHENASVIFAPGSGFQLTYVANWAVRRSVKRSISKGPHCWFSAQNRSGSSFQLLLSWKCRDW